jgi:hypothetical protein
MPSCGAFLLPIGDDCKGDSAEVCDSQILSYWGVRHSLS